MAFPRADETAGLTVGLTAQHSVGSLVVETVDSMAALLASKMVEETADKTASLTADPKAGVLVVLTAAKLGYCLVEQTVAH